MAYEPVKQETRDFYLKIWTHHSVGTFNKPQLAELFQCDDETILNGITWGAKNRTKFKPEVLAEAAMEAYEAKIRECNNDIIRLKAVQPVNWKAVFGLEKIVLEVRDRLHKLQGIVVDRGGMTINNVVASNHLVKVSDELAEGLSDDERRQLAARIREACRRPFTAKQVDTGSGVASGEPSV